MGLSFFAVVLASLRSMGTAITMAGFGAVLARGNGPLKPANVKNFARVSMLITIPCLLFSNILNCTQDWSTKPCTNVAGTIMAAWPMFLSSSCQCCDWLLSWLFDRLYYETTTKLPSSRHYSMCIWKFNWTSHYIIDRHTRSIFSKNTFRKHQPCAFPLCVPSAISNVAMGCWWGHNGRSK